LQRWFTVEDLSTFNIYRFHFTKSEKNKEPVYPLRSKAPGGTNKIPIPENIVFRLFELEWGYQTQVKNHKTSRLVFGQFLFRRPPPQNWDGYTNSPEPSSALLNQPGYSFLDPPFFFSLRAPPLPAPLPFWELFDSLENFPTGPLNLSKDLFFLPRSADSPLLRSS